MFVDDNANPTSEARRFRYLMGEVNSFVDSDSTGDRGRSIFTGNKAGLPTEQISIEALLDRLVELERTVSQNSFLITEANQRLNRKKEHRHVLQLASKVLASMASPVESSMSLGGASMQLQEYGQPNPLDSDEMLETGLLGASMVLHLTGVINTDRVERFKQVLFRACRSNVVTKTLPIEEKLIDYATNEPVYKCVFIIFVTAQEILKKVTNICHAFNCCVYECPRMTAEEASEMIVRKGLRQVDMERDLEVVRMTELQNQEAFWQIVHSADRWKETISRSSILYHHLNKFRVVGSSSGATTGQYMAVHAWLPAAREEQIAGAFGLGVDGKHMMEEPIGSSTTIPTFFPTDKATAAFQGIVNAYGVARYQELNPGLFAIVFFPFLFGVMFGDILHGTFLLIFALFCIIYEDTLAKIDNELFKMPFQGRYLILLMAIMSIYMGFIYNELASVPIDIWGSAWPESAGLEQPDPSVYTLIGHDGNPYPFGLDPAWRWSGNSIKFTNSLKMKMSIILGVSQMTLGVCLKAVNQIFWQKPANQPSPAKRRHAAIVLLHESVPELLLFMCSFGYLVILIFCKWSTNWNMASEGRVVWPRGPPQIINTLIDFAMAKPVCVPWLLLGKPYALKAENDGASRGITRDGHGDVPYQQLEEDAMLESEEQSKPLFDFTEIMINQTIHTIEYVLGCISNTASYLRLWALSLAHSQLSEVFWNYILNGQKFGVGMNSSVPMLVACFFVWLAATVGVLMVMETLSAFLHALRLQWVEFQSKFYSADGILFAPASFDEERD